MTKIISLPSLLRNFSVPVFLSPWSIFSFHPPLLGAKLNLSLDGEASMLLRALALSCLSLGILGLEGLVVIFARRWFIGCSKIAYWHEITQPRALKTILRLCTRGNGKTKDPNPMSLLWLANWPWFWKQHQKVVITHREKVVVADEVAGLHRRRFAGSLAEPEKMESCQGHSSLAQVSKWKEGL